MNVYASLQILEKGIYNASADITKVITMLKGQLPCKVIKFRDLEIATIRES